MIGNDIIDLQLARTQSNWQRPKYLEKIFTIDEQNLIKRAKNQELEIWKLWSRKEAAYKIYNRETGIKGYFPWKLKCSISKKTDSNPIDKVTIEDKCYYTKTYVNYNYVYTIAATSMCLFDKIFEINQNQEVIKINGLPCLKKNKKPVSVTHHGRFERKIGLLDL